MKKEMPTEADGAPKPTKSVYVPPSRRNKVDGSGSNSSAFSMGSRGPPRPVRNFNDDGRRNILDSSGLGDNSNQYPRRERFGERSFAGNRDHGSYPSPWATRDGRRYIRESEKEVFGEMDTCTHAGINFGSYENIPVEITGNQSQSIKPVEDFENGIHELLMVNILRVNYTKPTPIQKHSIPVIMAGRDLMACAQTGSGKTAAFLLPICTAMLKTGPPASRPMQSSYHSRQALPVCLVLSPTRELAMQTFTEARKFIYNTGIRAVVLYGGGEVRRQLYELERGCDICVATPGRLTDILERNRIGLHCVSYLVLDEADRMLDMGFAPQIRQVVEHSSMPQEGRQTVMFSATFPKEIQQLARDFLRDYLYLAVGRVGSTNEFIRQRLLYADQEQKLHYLVKLLRENTNGLVLIFVETKRRADMIESYLLKENFMAVNIHGDRSQQDREEALRLFKTGERPILVATDVAARGLDINNITHVINCDLPANIDDYVHRIGRTGRAGNVGVATSLVSEKDRSILKDLLALLEEANQEVPQWFEKLVASHPHSGGGRDYGKRASGGRMSRPFASRDVRAHPETVTYNQGNRGGGRSTHGFSQPSKGPGSQDHDDDWW
ncbi:DEAD/DEAH box helicase family protein [Babesia bovis T2Bo]|uniref:RNA helicase n=1 Tax=Babesia bovis TaxID=5865 RepID=A7AVF5_BABBO|nr:DEAD/DEAH box helicase family protein [Babesia bovis T2Bo]EDO05781.1 DEAD/DEAH box helicase family protein [Babesia bovis T2Bo]|eukprot:XP_001609349.1 DEAD/DEAH box helicase [Babesia bovis T2Bo]